MNDLFAPLFEMFFNYTTHQVLLGYVFDNLDYGKIGTSLLLLSLTLLLFYKVWNPIGSQRLKWACSVIGISVISYITTTIILYSNSNILEYIGNYTGENGQLNAEYFIVEMSIYSLIFSLVISFLYSILFKRFSTGNSHNPF